MRDEEQIGGYKNGVSYHQPLCKFRQMDPAKTLKNLART
jgi:hypothetical protein